jgi:hypothetical protein
VFFRSLSSLIEEDVVERAAGEEGGGRSATTSGTLTDARSSSVSLAQVDARVLDSEKHDPNKPMLNSEKWMRLYFGQRKKPDEEQF